jgi:alpha-ketoglutarate-dependent taurine dioxygenase
VIQDTTLDLPKPVQFRDLPTSSSVLDVRPQPEELTVTDAMTSTSISAALGDEVTVTPYAAGNGFPLFVEPASERLKSSIDETVAWFAERADDFEQILADAGAVVLRGFPIDDTDDFASLTAHLPSLEHGYSGGNAPRKAIKGTVMESTRAHPSIVIYLHQEMAYLPQYPSKLAFFSRIAAETGGETIIADVRQLEARLPAELHAAVRDRGLRYIRNFRSPDRSTGDAVLDDFHNNWALAFKTDDRAEVEAACAARGVQYEWQKDGSITLVTELPGFRKHPVTGKTVWFNQMHTMAMKPPVIPPELDDLMNTVYSADNDMTRPFEVQYGDGTSIPIEDLNTIYGILDELTVGFPWQHGDVMFVDNLHTAHGRNPFTGARDTEVQVFA